MKKVLVEQERDLELVNMVISNMLTRGALDVVIKKASKSLSERQRGLYWRWVTVLASEVGNTREEMHRALKAEYLVQIYLRAKDDHFELKAAAEALQVIRKNGTGEQYRFWRDYIIRNCHLRDASVDDMREYLDEVNSHAAKYRISLPPPEDGLL